MTRRHSPALVATVAFASLGLTLSACGSNTLDTTAGSGSTQTKKVEVQKDDALAAKVPEKVKAAGVIAIGTDASYAPNEFLAADGKTVVGMDVDLFNAVATVLGLKTDWKPSSFDSIITGVTGGKYDAGVSSFTINTERKKQVNMVSYFNAGTQWASAPDNPQKVDPQSPCGKTIAVQKGTTQLQDDMPARIAKCKASGTPIKLLVYEGQDQATAAVASGKADAMLADSPVVAYAIKQSDGKVVALGDIYDSAPYGFVIPKDQTEFAQAIADALKKLNDSGAYKSVLDKWGNSQGAITDFAVNPGS